MKRYALFVGEKEEFSGDFNEFRGSFDTVDRAAYAGYSDPGTWFHVVDTVTGKWLELL